jgi:RNA polymerase sigma-70 factor (ECF subfamily)
VDRPETSTEELLDRARHDDKSALGRVLVRQRPRLLARAAGRLFGNLARRVEPSELVQETMAIGAEKFPTLRGRDKFSFRNWLDKILDNVVLASIRGDRRKRRRTRSLSDASSLAPQLADPRTPLPDRLQRREDAEWACRAIAELDADDRRLLEARYLRGGTVGPTSDELAAEFGDTAANIRQRLHRIREVLKRGVALLQSLHRHDLPDAQARLLCRQHFRGWKVRQVADEFHVDEQAAAALIDEAQQALREAMEQRP